MWFRAKDPFRGKRKREENEAVSDGQANARRSKHTKFTSEKH